MHIKDSYIKIFILSVFLSSFVFVYYANSWSSVNEFVSNIDHCDKMLCDFALHYYPTAKNVFTSGIPSPGYFYSSFFAILLASLGMFSLDTALHLWMGVQIVALALLFLVTSLFLMKQSRIYYYLHLFLLLCCYPVLNNLKWGQVSILITLCVLGTLYFYNKNHRVIAALSLALGASIKYYPAIFIIYFIFKMDIKFLIVFAIFMVLFLGVVPTIGMGLDSHFQFYQTTMKYLAEARTWVPTDSNSQYIANVIRRLVPINFSAKSLSLLGYLIFLLNLFGVYSLARYRPVKGIYMAFVLCFLSIPFVIETSWPHYFVYLPFCQIILYVVIDKHEWFWLRLPLFFSVILSCSVFFNLIGHWKVYGYHGILFFSNLLLILIAWIYILHLNRGTFNHQVRQRLTLILILFLSGIALYAGWRLFWFLTDDAYISFRYVSNSMLGYGYTWNFPPFRPVEGYTNFLWVVLLDIVWRVTGVAPPDSANVISLIFAYGTTLLGVVMLLKMDLKPVLQKVRLLLLALVLIGVLTNRTYLTWMSSGLETAMFNFFATAWVFSCLFVPARTARWLVLMTLTAVLAALTRPDGLLLVAASAFLNGLTWINKIKTGCFRLHHLFTASPFFITIMHFLWRKHTYGEWLPNTYVAKYSEPWPESGWRYFLSFVIEYALWFWIGLSIVFLVYLATHVRFRQILPRLKAWLYQLTPTRPLITLTVVGAFLVHFAYYTLIIGGDHFEYRVYSHLILLIFLSSVWLLNQLKPLWLPSHRQSNGNRKWQQAWPVVIFLSLFILCGLPIPWTHWAVTHTLTGREVTFALHVPIAPQFTKVLRPYVNIFDNLQLWLVNHAVCNRHQEHKAFHEFMLQRYPSRSRGILLSPDNLPVMPAASVGVPGWMLPTTNIIDVLGLNDYVVARNPILSTRHRMAHDRTPPIGYVKCFEPNVKSIAQNKIVVASHDLDADTISNCENHDWPASIGDKLLDIAVVEDPRVDDYFWSVWPPDFLYVYFASSEQDNKNVNTELVATFSEYTGSGCVITPPVEQLINHETYMFAFLPALGRPELSALTSIFPWTQFITERWARLPLVETLDPYHLGYIAPAGPEMTLKPDQPRTNVWENGLQFLGYDLPQTTYRPGDTIPLTLYYRPTHPIQPGHSVFVHLLGPHNPSTGTSLWGQDDGEPCRGLYPMAHWEPGSTVMTKMIISIPENAPTEDNASDYIYELAIGFYNWQTGERVPLRNATVDKDRVTLTQVHIETHPTF